MEPPSPTAADPTEIPLLESPSLTIDLTIEVPQQEAGDWWRRGLHFDVFVPSRGNSYPDTLEASVLEGLLPPELLEETAQVLAYGAAKYSANNWAVGANWGRYFAAQPGRVRSEPGTAPGAGFDCGLS